MAIVTLVANGVFTSVQLSKGLALWCVYVRKRVNFARAEVSRIRIVFFLNLRCCGSLR